MYSRRRKRPQFKGLRLFLVGTGLAAVAALAWWQFRPDSPATPEASTPLATVASPEAETREAPSRFEGLELPPLDASDEFLRTIVTELSRHPQLSAWLATDALIHRFVTSVIDLAGERSPRERLDFLAPTEPIRVTDSEGMATIDPASFERYALVVETFASLDTEGTAELYRALHPLFEEAFAEYGIPDWTFDETLGRAIDNVLAVEVSDAPISVEDVRTTVRYADPSLEAGTDLQKLMHRVGATNAARIQAKLAELREAIERRGP